MFPSARFPARRRAVTGVLLFAVSAALTLLCTPIVFAALSTTGRWTPLPTGTSPANWDHPPIHMALLRGDSNYHSYIMSWYQNPNDSTWLGGLWGWNPSGTDDGCLAYPESTLVKITSQPAAPGAQIFCAGHAALADGRLLVAGGTDRVGETAGIKDVRIFNAQSKTWSAADTMAFRRYYPTNTTLPDGRVLVNEGWQYDHMLTFGGRTVPGNSTSAQKKIERLTILDTAHWDAQITDPGGTTDWPEERAFHTAVIRRDPADPANEDHMRMMLFGGADTNGVALRDTWMLKRSQWNDTTESYTWEQIADGPRRARHGAIVNNDYSMYIFGGFDADSVVQSDVRRLFKNASNEWQWEVKTTSGTDTPGARYGHVVAHDTIPGRNRMIVFGGRDENGLVDNEVYALKLSDLSWSRLDRVTGSPSPPAAREGNSILVEDARRYTRGSPSSSGWSRMFVFGGRKASVLTDELWVLWINPAGDKVEWEQLSPTSPNGAPTARANHSAIWQRPDNDNRMLIYGGDTGSQSDSTVWALEIDDSQAEWIPQGPSGSALSGHTAIVDFIAIQATKPEIFDPNEAAGSQWTTLADATLRYQYYPYTFVLPSGNVYMAGPHLQTYILTLTGDTTKWERGPDPKFWGMSAVMYRPGKIMKCGGIDGPNDYDTERITFDAEDGYGSGWAGSYDFHTRLLHNLTLLPDGTVLANGGRDHAVTGAPGLRRPQIWDPAGFGSWTPYTELDQDPAYRDHHSTAILLPDGRVLSAGASDVDSTSASEVTVYCPPNLFSGDNLADRPVISAGADTVVWDHPFSVTTPQAGSIASAALVKPSAVTHSFNQDQRYVPLTIRVNESGKDLILDAPVSGNYAPPGDYMLFLVDTSGVPSVAKWVRVRGQPETGACADISPAVVTITTDGGRESGLLTWSAPGENGLCGTVQSYDMRRSNPTVPTITNANFYSATPMTAPAPLVAGSEHCVEVDNLNPCGAYSFAFKTRDAAGVWSKVSVGTVQTDCSGYEMMICDGGGLFAGGGGGGGSLRQTLELNRTGSEPVASAEEAAAENSILWATDSGHATDLRRVTGLTDDGNGQYTIPLRQVGTWKTSLDQLGLGVVEHAAAEVAIAGPDRVLVGTLGTVASVLDSEGSSVTGLTGTGVQPRELRAGEHLTAALNGPTARTAIVVESSWRAARGGEDLSGIRVQTPGPDGMWMTVGEIQPRRQFDRSAVIVGQSASVRLVFPRACTARSLAQLEVARQVLPEPLELVSATKPGAGAVTVAVGQAGGEATSVEPGDSLTVKFAAPQGAAEGIRELFLTARGSMESMQSQGAMESAGHASEMRESYVYSLGQARPNPSAGEVTIDFTLAQRSPVSFRVYDVAGRLVRSLVNEELAEGPQSVLWDGRTDAGQRVGAGVFFYRLIAGGWHSERKLIVLQR